MNQKDATVFLESDELPTKNQLLLKLKTDSAVVIK
jgi:hypothetical protein